MKSMRDIDDREGVKQERRICVGCRCLQVSVRANSVRNLLNLVVWIVRGVGLVGLNLSRCGATTVTPAQIAGIEGYWDIKATPIYSMAN